MPPRRQTVAELRELQRLTAAVVMRRLTSAHKTNPRWIDGGSTAQVVAGFIRPNDRMTSFERLELYNRQYWFRLLECLSEDYPGLRAVLGGKTFSNLAQAYLAECPSESFTMRNLGRSLVGFIESHSELVAPRGPLAIEMATLEWAHIEAFDNAAEVPLVLSDLANFDPQHVRLRLQPYLTLLRLEHPLDEFLIAVRRHQGLRHEASNAVGKRRKLQPMRWRSFRPSSTIHLAVHRHRDAVFYKRLTPAQFVLLSALQQHCPLEQALEQALVSCAGEKVTPATITKWFRNWSSLGWFCKVAATRIRRPSNLTRKR